MTTTQLLQLLFSFLTAGGVTVAIGGLLWKVFGQKIVDETTKQSIELLFTSDKTEASEKVKHFFNQSLEKVKSQLQRDTAREVALMNRDNIRFQISNAEYTKRQFDKVEGLYGRVFEMRNFAMNANYNTNKSIEDVNIDYNAIKGPLVRSQQEALFYLDEESVKAIAIYTSKYIRVITQIRRIYAYEKLMNGHASVSTNYGMMLSESYPELEERQNQVEEAFLAVSQALSNLLKIPAPSYITQIDDSEKED